MTVLAGLFRLRSFNLSHNQIHTIIQVSWSEGLDGSFKENVLLVCLIKTKKFKFPLSNLYLLIRLI